MSAVLPSSSTSGSVPSSPVTTPARDSANAPARVRAEDHDDDSDDTVVGAIERLALSRERLRDAMMPRRRARASGPTLTEGVGAYANGLLDRLRANPGTAVILDAIEEWWAKHPLHTAGVMAAEATTRLAAPVAERRPLTLVFGAVFVGAVLALLRPWRLLLRPAIFAGLVPAIMLRVMRELPVDTWLRAATGFVRQPRDERADMSSTGTPVATDGGMPAGTRPSASAADVETNRAEPSTVYP
jgi:hypothetical protein